MTKVMNVWRIVVSLNYTTTNIAIEGIRGGKGKRWSVFLFRGIFIHFRSALHSYRSFMLLYSPLAKSPAYEVKRNRIDAAVDEAQAEAEDPEDVPEIVVVLLGRWAKVEP